MKSRAEQYIEKLEELFGKEDLIKKVECPNGKHIFVFYYFDLPEKGMITSVTYGLSESEHPNWKFGKPELIVTLDSQDIMWGYASGYLASQYRGECGFSYGTLLRLPSVISEESDMVGFFAFVPSILNKEKSRIEIGDEVINLVGMYPIYEEEKDLICEVGLKEFWHTEGYDMYDVKRKNLGLEGEKH